MGIIEVGEKFTRSGEQNGKGEVTYTRLFQVVTDDPWTGAKAVREAVPIDIGDPYITSTESDSASVCISKSASCNSEDGKQWYVAVSYGDNSKVEEDNPLNEPAEISWDGQNELVPADIDADQIPVLNSAGDPYSDSVQVEESRTSIKIVRNEAVYDDAIADLYRNTINAGPFMGRARDTVKCVNISASRVTHPVIGIYYKITYEFLVNPRGWQTKLVNAGLRELVEHEGVLVKRPILKGGVPVSEPALLDENGKALPDGEDAPPPVIRTHRFNQRMPFTAFNFS